MSWRCHIQTREDLIAPACWMLAPPTMPAEDAGGGWQGVVGAPLANAPHLRWCRTGYVFCEQCLQEMLLLFARGSHTRYRRLVFHHYLFFTAGCGTFRIHTNMTPRNAVSRHA